MNNLFEQFENHALFQTIANRIDFISNALKENAYNEKQKEELIEKIEANMKQKIEEKELFLIRWSLI